MSPAGTWEPDATPAGIQRRADALKQTRAFFAARNIIEVETPILCAYGVTEPHIRNIEVALDNEHLWLRTSPEYHMKRLLAAGSPDIYQIGKAFRGGERGSRHEPEFTLIEWYRRDFALVDLRDECCDLIIELSQSACRTVNDFESHSYCELFVELCGVNPLETNSDELSTVAKRLLGQETVAPLDNAPDSDPAPWLDLLASHVVYPSFKRDVLIVVTDYPCEQAMLARLQPQNTRLADRFEIFLNGLELANGFHELGAATEQAERFERDRRRRKQLGLPDMLPDPALLDAIESGLPDCCGVAVGLDRVLMATDQHEHIRTTTSFTSGS